MPEIGAKRCCWALILAVFWPGDLWAQFLDDFSQDTAAEWQWFTGDGEATIQFVTQDGIGRVTVDANKDERNIWWALIKRDVSAGLDLSRLREPNQELRISARVRTSHAPRRVNLHLNTQKTTDFHSHLMEFDLPTAGEWHSISYTTKDFEAEPGDTVNGQLALMDWGRGKYGLEVDDFRVEVVDVTTAGPDQGVLTPYRPPVPPLAVFQKHLPATEAAILDSEYPETNFADWRADEKPVLSVGGSQYVILRWDLQEYAGRQTAGTGVLELTTRSVERIEPPPKDFGMIRVAEVLGGDPQWTRKTVKLVSLLADKPIDAVFNPQMIIDVPVAIPGGKTLVTINRAVVQRMLDGRTHGLVISPLGAIRAAFELEGGKGPRLHLSLEP